MPAIFSAIIAGALALAAANADATNPLTRPMPGKAEWTQPLAPIRIHGDTWYVGSKGISTVLIRTDAGLILIDVGLPQSAPQVEANIAGLGFKLSDLKVVLNSHAHFDHAGGIAARVRDSDREPVGRKGAARWPCRRRRSEASDKDARRTHREGKGDEGEVTRRAPPRFRT